jgi:Ser/Thr protein kinase RdoA (MazF antagonist)
LNQAELREIISARQFEWRKHVLQRLAQRNISQKAVLDALLAGELIEDYPEDKPYPSALFLGWVEGKPLYIVVSLDESNEWAYIITAYEPSLEYFEPDFKTRRK